MGFWQDVRQDIDQHKGVLLIGTAFYAALVLLNVVIIMMLW